MSEKPRPEPGALYVFPRSGVRIVIVSVSRRTYVYRYPHGARPDEEHTSKMLRWEHLVTSGSIERIS